MLFTCWTVLILVGQKKKTTTKSQRLSRIVGRQLRTRAPNHQTLSGSLHMGCTPLSTFTSFKNRITQISRKIGRFLVVLQINSLCRDIFQFTHFSCGAWKRFGCFSRCCCCFFEMGRFTEQGESKGFIKELFQDLQSNLTAEQVKNFANLENDEARFKFISQQQSVKDFQVTKNKSIKNLTLALDFKQKGNKEFQAKNWIAALDFYNKGLLLLPADHGMFRF